MPALSGSSSTFGLRLTVFTQLIVDKLVVAGQPLLLVLHRTHWQLGQTDLNLLCLGLVFQGVSILGV